MDPTLVRGVAFVIAVRTSNSWSPASEIDMSSFARAVQRGSSSTVSWVLMDVRHLLFLARLGHSCKLEKHDQLIYPMWSLLACSARYLGSTVQVPISSCSSIQLAVSKKQSSIELCPRWERAGREGCKPWHVPVPPEQLQSKILQWFFLLWKCKSFIYEVHIGLQSAE